MQHELRQAEGKGVPLFLLKKLYPLQDPYGDDLEIIAPFYLDWDQPGNQIVFMYGLALTPRELIIWRLSHLRSRGLERLRSIALPLSEYDERNAEELIAEAISSGAWD